MLLHVLYTMIVCFITLFMRINTDHDIIFCLWVYSEFMQSCNSFPKQGSRYLGYRHVS